ncbi:MAG: hypothetical protein WCG27_02060 [Pseudomonadota bacterium]
MKEEKKKTALVPDFYSRFREINGKHPLQDSVPDSFVDYQVRRRHGGKLVFFNFDLAKEMGLLPENHPEKMNPALEKEIMETFSLVIINEYDRMHNLHFPKKDIHPYPYMATRYLQLQHPNKQGKTSGDGRSIWNGHFVGGGKVWDISSCGTGATRLSPASNINNKFYKTGDPTISYGCGLSDIDEGLGSLFFSEVLHRNYVSTERVLGVIGFPGGVSINIRAYPNLLRPSHFLMHLKQGNLEALKRLTNYHLNRQERNKEWFNIPRNEKQRYQCFLEKITQVFARAAAQFEDEYVFCWMDWDGDNILMDGGIIDYGSVRQFGLFHHEYRYNDVDRYSTNILEQRLKARYIVQSFAQMVDYLIRGKKRPIGEFANGLAVKRFDQYFEHSKDINFLKRIGFSGPQGDFLRSKHLKLVRESRRLFSYFERAKSCRGTYKVSDGITSDAIFCMRDLLRSLPQLYLSRGIIHSPLSDEEFINLMKSSYAKKKDLRPCRSRSRNIQHFQKTYQEMVLLISEQQKKTWPKILLEITMRSSVINKYDRVTGNSILLIVDKVMKARPSLDSDTIFKILQQFANFQTFDPKIHPKKDAGADHRSKKYLQGLLRIVRDNREGL